MRREAVGAARLATTPENSCVFPRIAYNAAAGVEQTGPKPALPRWGFSHLGRQTERERIPKPRKISRNRDLVIRTPRSPRADRPVTALIFTVLIYAGAVQKVPGIAVCDYTFLDAPLRVPVARIPTQHVPRKNHMWNIEHVFCEKTLQCTPNAGDHCSSTLLFEWNRPGICSVLYGVNICNLFWKACFATLVAGGGFACREALSRVHTSD